MASMDFTVEQFKAKVNTSKFLFAIFTKKNETTGITEIQYCRDAEGKIVTYTDPQTGEQKNLPKVVVRDTARNLLAFCSAEVSKTKILGGKALEGTYFEGRVKDDGTIGYQLRRAGTTRYDLSDAE